MEAIRNAGGMGKAGWFQPDYFFLMQNFIFTFSILGLKSVQEQKDDERQQKQETQAKAMMSGGDLMSDLVMQSAFLFHQTSFFGSSS
jgi:hypothetical protein